MNGWFKFLIILVVFVFVIIVAMEEEAVLAFEVREGLNEIEELEFSAEEMYIPQVQVSLEEIMEELPNRDEWISFVVDIKGGIFYFDPRSGGLYR